MASRRNVQIEGKMICGGDCGVGGDGQPVREPG
jgi:hypothetical protein